MIPMFRVRASGTCRATVFSMLLGLPLEMAEGLVGLGHLVRVFASLDRRADAVHGVDELGRELLAHALAVPLAGRLDEPADSERHSSLAADLDRDLVGRPTDAPRLHLDDRGRVAECGLEDLETRPVRVRLGAGEGLAKDPIGQVALAVGHQLGGEPGGRPVDRDRLVFRHPRDALPARHYLRPPTAGAAFAPDLLRPRLPARTPAPSS